MHCLSYYHTIILIPPQKIHCACSNKKHNTDNKRMYCIYPACCNSAIKHRQSICKYYTYSHYCAIKDTSVFVHTSEMVKCYNCHHLTHRSCTCCNNAQHKCIKYRFSKYYKYNKIEYKLNWKMISE